MKKVITAQDIQEARKAGLSALPLPPGAIITPQARDDAKAYGIALQNVSQTPASSVVPPPAVQPLQQPSGGVSAGMPSFVAQPRGQTVVPALRPVLAALSGTPQAPVPAVPEMQTAATHEGAARHPMAARQDAAPHAEPPRATPSPAAASAPAGGQALPESFIAEIISRQVAQHLGNRVGMDRINAVVQDVLNERKCAAVPNTSAASALPPEAGAVLVRGREALPAQPPSGDAVIVTDSLLPDARGPGIGYVQLADSAFAWTFAADEVFVVLEGELRVAGAGTDLIAGPGDALLLPAGFSCTLSGRGRTSCVYSSWPR